ncbi:GNAT family N-acetyltransferase [Phenylobacterium sp. LH3H17]|uniref:GNAT family N-acetyltransferase n=1 Tax=Phenylobacterium sp. LH3H17 TaxID=2903901 RepID=UPI0020C9C4CE|nr:GNAT family N-acetyltransferase [Phenylobacterium sp. LH3H17]UTP38046.1 GNAT family N-acetyltransferase [Phenylobacterium sp. LH3H17]
MVAALDVPTLRSQRLILEPLSSAHTAGMFALWSRPEVCEFSGGAIDIEGRPIRLPARTPEDSDKIIAFFAHGAARGARFRWAMLTRNDRSFVGAVGFNALGACAELAYHLRPDYWGQGLMTEAAVLALNWLRRRPGAVEVEAFVEPANLASVRLIERLGLNATGETADGADRYLMALGV